ncbi:MAG: squalene/phytoene synthase family protein [Microbacterium sp.]|uniref:phytoene/squalene synthase family protein n=1 Tax=Microbacterium sp. TaxID=51671 RepID=UPI0039E61B73
MTDRTGLALYDRAASQAAGGIIEVYSTSFALAARMLGPRVRAHVRHVYALVRIADEVVDGPAAQAGVDTAGRARILDGLEREVDAALADGFSANPVVHAFAGTARACGISADLTAPFFASMRTDLTTVVHDPASHDAYVYGSAEVVGLMCLAVFVNAGTTVPVRPAPDLVVGARRLGRAFQDVNFLRDRADDAALLGRDYLAIGDDHDRDRVLDGVDADLAAAAAVIGILPPDCRRAVTAAHDLFAALSRRLRSAPPDAARVRVPTSAKLAVAARAWLGGAPQGVRS